MFRRNMPILFIVLTLVYPRLRCSNQTAVDRSHWSWSEWIRCELDDDLGR
jgi:hypothetical protein